MNRFCVLSILILGCAALRADILFVGSGGYSTIQSAIDDANTADVVIVSPGTYQETIDFLGKAITVRSTDPNDPNIVAITIIDGSSPADPNSASVVTFKSSEGNDSVLSGFTITGGTGSWILVSWEFYGLNWNRCGGGVLCCNMSAPTISNNVFVDNTAGQGAGIYIYGDHVNPDNPSNPAVHISPVIVDNTFINNSAFEEHGFSPPDANYPANDHGDGGAIVAFQGCDPVITGNLIENNHADFYGGGIHLRQWSNGSIEDNQILDNDSRLGAGIHITYTSGPTVRDNLIEGNSATSLGGGGIYVYYLSEPLIERNLITDNTSTNGAGISIYYSSAGTVRNNLIYSNNAGAGMRIVGSSPVIINNTITDNYNGGIDCASNSEPQIINNIITSNGSGWGIWVHSDSSPAIRFNNIWANASGTFGPVIPPAQVTANISKDPAFINDDANDYHLNYDSPCINAGDPNFADLSQTDFAGRPRIMGQYVDIGAYETSPVWNITTYTGYDTIQHAVDDANAGQTIVLTIGTHTGDGNRDIRFYGKQITVQSIDPNDAATVAATIIDSNGSPTDLHRAFYFRDGEDANSVVAGLTITGGGGVYDGGAIKCSNASSPTIKNCIITANFSGGRGTIYTEHYSNPLILNCAITNNIATRGYGAAVCAFYDSSPTILNCLIANNHAVGTGHHGGGVCCWDGSNALVVNCIVVGNTAGHRGGGLYAYWSSPTFINCTVIGNKSLEGGGIGSFRESNPLVVNCIVRDNISPDGNQIALINTSRVWEGTNIGTEMTVLSGDIEGGQADANIDHDCTLYWLAGNIDIDPNFVNAGYWDDANTPAEPNDDFFVPGNYHLLPRSAFIDAGDNNSLPPFLTYDIDAEQRIFNDTVDIGTDEVVTNPMDLDLDGIVDFYELALLADEWLQTGGALQTDFYFDGIIDFADFTLLANQWFWQGGWYQ